MLKGLVSKQILLSLLIGLICTVVRPGIRYLNSSALGICHTLLVLGPSPHVVKHKLTVGFYAVLPGFRLAVVPGSMEGFAGGDPACACWVHSRRAVDGSSCGNCC